jgi:hypothetical protein
VTEIMPFKVCLFHREGGTKVLYGATPGEVKKRVERICEKFKNAYIAATVIHEPELSASGLPRVYPSAWADSFSHLVEL